MRIISTVIVDLPDSRHSELITIRENRTDLNKKQKEENCKQKDEDLRNLLIK